MEIPRQCTSDVCDLCHGNLGELLHLSTLDGPSYSQPTKASISRAIAARNETLRRERARPTVASSNGTGPFESLPVEIRLQIYRFCLQAVDDASPPKPPKPKGLIIGDVKGGGWHADIMFKGRKAYLDIYVPEKFPLALLLLNRKIYNEAVHELYTALRPVFVFAHRIPDHLQDHAKYWLTAHPMRFMKRMSFLFNVRVGISHPGFVQYMTNAVLSKKEIDQLSILVARLPNINELYIDLQIQPYFNPMIPTQRWSCEDVVHDLANKALWRKKLGLLAGRLPERVKAYITMRSLVTPKAGPGHHEDNVRIADGLAARNLGNLERFEFRASHDNGIARPIGFAPLLQL